MRSGVAPHVGGLTALTIRVRGLVQGVGFRPTVWRLARRHQLRGHVSNDGQGVRIYLVGSAEAAHRFVADLQHEPPALARIDEVTCEPGPLCEIPPEFTIAESEAGVVTTGIVPDAATCPECVTEVFDPASRRFHYPFATCTYCGPRLTIQETIPYDRAGTTMRRFTLCPACDAEYRDPNDRRFHAQPIACRACGPRVWLERAGGMGPAETVTDQDPLIAACTLLQRGHVIAIKGLGGVQLACDATQEGAVARLRDRKVRAAKPFALMARDLEIIRRWCEVSEQEAALLESPAAPIVILRRQEGAVEWAQSVAPGLRTLGVMLPHTPLHYLLLRHMDRPIVLTSGNRSDEPQWIDNADATVHLGGIAEYFLLHDRPIAQRVDDSVTTVMGGVPRVLRRSRGYAPAPVLLPEGFEAAPPVLAMGGEVKNTFCLLAGRRAILSHHIGDLEDARTLADYRRALVHYAELFAHAPQMLAVDRHPDYLSSRVGRDLARERVLPLYEVQHHHAHIAACLAEHGVPLDHPPVLGVALDGLGYGDDGTLWGGEFLVADYRSSTRVGTFKPVPLLGGKQAIHEPWRNTYAHLMAALGWERFAARYESLDLYRALAAKPRRTLDQMIARGLNSPPASSCGRLFDAVAAALGLCRERVTYEGQAAVELEQLVTRSLLEDEKTAGGYPFAIQRLTGSGLPYLEPLGMWRALLEDLLHRVPVPVMAARFHRGLAEAVCAMVEQLTCDDRGERTIHDVALSGGVFQNRILFEMITTGLDARGFRLWTHTQVPANDGGLALGQAVVAAARALRA